MKHWPSLSLPLVLLTVISAITFWLSQRAQIVEIPEASPPRHEADVIGENLTIRRYDEQGRIKYRLTTPHLTHFPDDDSSLLKEPVLISYRQDAEPITVTSLQAHVTSKGETVLLIDDVRINRPSGNNRPDLIARMPDLTVQPEAGLASTASPVEITQGESRVTGIGMHIDNNTSILTLDSQVRGIYLRSPRAKP